MMRASGCSGLSRGAAAPAGTAGSAWRSRRGCGLLRLHAVDRVEADERVELLAALAVARLPHRPVMASPLRRPYLRTWPARRRRRRAGQVAGGADERVVVEHVEDAGDRDQDVVLVDQGSASCAPGRCRAAVAVAARGAGCGARGRGRAGGGRGSPRSVVVAGRCWSLLSHAGPGWPLPALVIALAGGPARPGRGLPSLSAPALLRSCLPLLGPGALLAVLPCARSWPFSRLPLARIALRRLLSAVLLASCSPVRSLRRRARLGARLAALGVGCDLAAGPRSGRCRLVAARLVAACSSLMARRAGLLHPPVPLMPRPAARLQLGKHHGVAAAAALLAGRRGAVGASVRFRWIRSHEVLPGEQRRPACRRRRRSG